MEIFFIQPKRPTIVNIFFIQDKNLNLFKFIYTESDCFNFGLYIISMCVFVSSPIHFNNLLINYTRVHISGLQNAIK